MTLNDPELVRREYADENRFTVRQTTWNQSTGPDVHDLILKALAEVSPVNVLEVGPGKGELAERIARELHAHVVAVDQSERMVELTRARGVDSRVGDVQKLPCADAEYDCAVAAWMLYHVPDLNRGLSELARVLRPGGRLVAVTNSRRNLRELWSLFGKHSQRVHPFSAENGGEALGRHFERVERREARGTVTFAARHYVAASPTRAHLADELPKFEGPLMASRAVTVFVSEKAA